ncbi:MAG: squalene/phytoene synthase family protein [Wenzhouxiangella sp.]|jgi:phytoene/squalene synthetase|nr:squalene/phytoene synthase family protein [Wenzhouxiangella sp.]
MNALQWCSDRLLVPGHPLAASLRFVPSPERERVLALRALVSELAALDDPGVDGTVREARFGWWQQALVEGAEHPALRALAESGAAEFVPPRHCLSLLDSIRTASANPRFERSEELWAHCAAIGGEAAHLELRLAQDSAPAPNPAVAVGAAGYLIRLVRDLGQDASNNRWLVPLDLQAQFQVNRRDALDARAGPGWDGLVRTLLDRAVRQGSAASVQLPPGCRHLPIYWALERRLAAQLARRPAATLSRRVLPGHAGNVWTAWRAARRLTRATKA